MRDGPNLVLAFDFGMRQIGVATGNPATRMATALEVLPAKEGLPQWSQVEQLLAEWKPQLALVGLPLNMDGSESSMSERARRFANRLQGRFGLRVELVDERLSSFEAKERARLGGHRGDYKKAPVDALAAEILAEQWLADQ